MSDFAKQKSKLKFREKQHSLLQIKCWAGQRQASAMQRNAVVITGLCVMMCLTFNSTFPLHRAPDGANKVYPNQTQQFGIVDRTKKMASNLEHALKRFKDTTQDFGKNIYDHVSSGIKEHIQIINEDDLRQYEQMVIMKKYPYLDLKELHLKFSPSKNTRQSETVDRGPAERGSDPSIWEPMIEIPNVEITNRGLSGFAIPPELSRSIHVSSIADTKAKCNTDNSDKTDVTSKITKKSSVKDVLGSLQDDIMKYVEKKINK